MKKGFTLIELLATIVVLGIISAITFPNVAKIIENTKQQTALRSAESYVTGVNDYLLSSTATNAVINNRINTADDLKNNGLKYNGDTPINLPGGVPSKVCVSNNKVTHYALCFKDYVVIDGVVLTTTMANYNDYINLSNYLFAMEESAFTGNPIGSVGFTPTEVVSYILNGEIKNYAIIYASGNTNVALTDGHLGVNNGYIKVYADTARIITYIYNNNLLMTSGTHTLDPGTYGNATLTKTSSYDVAGNDIIDYSLHFSGYVNNSGQIKVE